MNKFLNGSSGDEPLAMVLNMCREANTKGYRLLMNTVEYVGDPVVNNIHSLREQCITKRDILSRIDTYMSLNPNLVVHPVYMVSEHYIPDYQRISFSRFRLSSHRLRVESGRWARIPRMNRLCTCGMGVQDEAHVMFHCPRSTTIRQTFNIDNHNWMQLFEKDNICQITYEILNIYNKWTFIVYGFL